MEEYSSGIDLGGCSRPFILATILVVLLGFVVGMLALSAIDHAGASRDYAEAARIRAQADLEAQRQENWERRWMAWTVTLATITHDPLAIIILVCTLAATGGLAYLLVASRQVLS